MPFKTVIGLALAAAALAFTAAAPAQTYKAEYKMSLVVGPAFPWGKGGEIWANLVRERTQGRINIKLYPGVSLIQGDQTREFSAIRQGVIDMAIGSTINWSPQVKELNVFSLPFLMPDYAAADALTQGEVGKEIFRVIDKAGVVPLAWGENGYREISNSKLAIKKPEDMKGLKIRVVGSPLFLDTFTALGANPTQMSCAELCSLAAMKIDSGFSCPSTAPVASAGCASAKLICVGLAPSAAKVSRNSGEPTTRIFSPFMSSGFLMASLELLISR